MGKGFTLTHQRVVLDLALSGEAKGHAEFSVTPADSGLKIVYLHARDLVVTAVQVDGSPSVFHLSHPLHTVITTPSSTNNIRSAYPEFKRKLFQATNEEEEGELAVVLPAGVVRKVVSRPGSLAPQPNEASAVEGAGSPDPNIKGGPKEPEYESIQVLVEYEIRSSVRGDGIHVIRPSDLYPHRIPHCYTSAATPDAARCWVPCVDSLWERCTWELVFSVPRVVSYEQETDNGIEVEEFPVVCVASGELMEQIIHPHNPNKTIFHFSQAAPTSVQHIAFAYGPFSIVDISPSAQQAQTDPNDPSAEEQREAEVLALEAEGQLQMHAFCLPGREEELQTSVGFMTRALEFFVEEFGSYPFSSYKMVFVDDSPVTMFNSAALGLFSTELLYPSTIIDQAYETRQTLTYSLAAQWVGINIVQKTWADTWLIQGLSLYVNGLCLRRLMGNNEYRFRLKKDVTRCCAWDVKMPPVCQPGIMQPPAADLLPFINIKSPLILHILDRQLLKAGTHNGLSRVIPKLYLSAISGDLKENLLSTHNFLRMCRKVSGADLRGFAEQWIYAAGCPRFHINATFNRKRMAVELAIKQESPAYMYAEQAEWTEKVNLRPINVFEGQMTVRIHEADGTPYEHVIDIRDAYKKHEVGFNTKYKRIRRSTKRFQARKAAEEAAAAGDVEAIEAVGNIDTSFTLPLWEDSRNENTGREREKWKVADWSEEDEKTQEQAVYEWIRIDTEFEWIAQISFEQPDFMWISQLQRDRDVVAQLEAVHALANMRTTIVASTLAKTILVTNYFYRIRMEAALALVGSSANRNLDYLGLFYLFKIFQTRFCFEPEHETSDPFDFRCVPRPNDFSDFSEYHLRKILIIAISHIRDEKGNPFPQIQQFLVDLLTYNDNAQNAFSDAYYITTIIAALGNPFVSAVMREQSELAALSYFEAPPEQAILTAAVDEVTRYTNLDRLVPSYHNVITVAGVEWRVKMMMASLIPLDLKFLFAYTREGNYPIVRIAAFDGLLLLRSLQEKVIARYIFAVLRFDSCRVVQRRLAQSLVENLPILAAMDELSSQEPGYIEEEARLPQKPASQSVESLLKVLRNSVGRSIMLRDSMMAVMLSPNVDLEIRWCILKLCEVLIKPSEEPLPKLKIRMPANVLRLSSLATPASPDVPLSVATGTNILSKIRLGGTEAVPRKEITEVPATLSQSLKLVLGNKKNQPKLSREQKSGMSMQDLKVCQNLLQKISASKKADLFRRPVDPIRDGAPSYFEHIKQPMDLSTMANKLDAGLYKDRFAFRDDFKLMIANCYLFNGKESLAGKLGDAFDAFFDKQWDRANATLEQLRRKAHAQMTSASEAFGGQANIISTSPHHSAVPSTVPNTAESKFVSPQPLTPAPIAPTPGSTRPLTLKLSLSSSSNLQPVPLPNLIKEISSGPIKSEGPTPLLPPMPTQEPTPNTVSQEPSDIRSSSPAVPLAIIAPAVPNRPKIKFSTRPVSEYVAETVNFVEPMRPPVPPSQSPPAPPATISNHRASSSVEPVNKPKKIRLSINGLGGMNFPPPSATPSVEPVSISTPFTSNGHRKTYSQSNRASSVSSTGDYFAPVNVKKMAALLWRMLHMDESFFFRRPVDPVADGCPTYYNEIKHPMDLGTMQAKLNAAQYQLQGEMNGDFEQIVENCKIFNPPGTLPIAHAESLQKFWHTEVAKATKLSYQEKRALQGMMNRLRLKPSASIFLEAVDPEALGIPMYFSVIHRQDARDISLIKRKVDNDEYHSLEAFETDFRLMLNNCYVFNGEDSPAFEVGKILEAEFERELDGIKLQISGAGVGGGGVAYPKIAKRPSNGGSGGMIKKIKLSTS